MDIPLKKRTEKDKRYFITGSLLTIHVMINIFIIILFSTSHFESHKVYIDVSPFSIILFIFSYVLLILYAFRLYRSKYSLYFGIISFLIPIILNALYLITNFHTIQNYLSYIVDTIVSIFIYISCIIFMCKPSINENIKKIIIGLFALVKIGLSFYETFLIITSFTQNIPFCLLIILFKIISLTYIFGLYLLIKFNIEDNIEEEAAKN